MSRPDGIQGRKASREGSLNKVNSFERVGLKGEDPYSSPLKPLLKWAGGKEKELRIILPELPREFVDFYDPFVGGGAVYTAVNARNYYINDRSEELIELYKRVRENDEGRFFELLEGLARSWERTESLLNGREQSLTESYRAFSKDRLSEKGLRERVKEDLNDNPEPFTRLSKELFGPRSTEMKSYIQDALLRKMGRMKRIEKEKNPLPEREVLQNIESGIRGGYYSFIRSIYNRLSKDDTDTELRIACFFFIRNFCYSGMFRYNKNGDFNVPYGGIAYNRKSLGNKVSCLRSKELKELLSRTFIENTDFEEFLEENPPSSEDLLFLDPPYDSNFSTYAGNSFGKEDQARLADYLKRKCRAKWMLVIKNTEYIRSLYQDPDLHIRSFHKKYLVSFKNRNEKEAEHLMITNYAPPA
jgi:DNA adenine methylase